LADLNFPRYFQGGDFYADLLFQRQLNKESKSSKQMLKPDKNSLELRSFAHRLKVAVLM
jgi:hypothetical protein